MLGRSALIALAALASIGTVGNSQVGGGFGQVAKEVSTNVRSVDRSAPNRSPNRSTVTGLYGGFGYGSRRSGRRARPGWSFRQVKRMSTKARNVKRSRSQARGRK
jgi:hypothetical protein